MSNFIRVNLDEKFEKDFSAVLKKCVDSACEIEKIVDIDSIVYTSDQYLKQCLIDKKDFPVAEKRNLNKFSQDLNRKLIRFLIPVYPNCSIIPSGNFVYPPGGYMGWHTNSDFPCKRVYITYVTEINKSGFKYLDVNQNIIDDVDDQTITVREFNVSSENHLWHCVYSNTFRYSFGFRIEPF